jgi:hypothetical protein
MCFECLDESKECLEVVFLLIFLLDWFLYYVYLDFSFSKSVDKVPVGGG